MNKILRKTRFKVNVPLVAFQYAFYARTLSGAHAQNPIKRIHMKRFVLLGGINLNFPRFKKISLALKPRLAICLIAVLVLPSGGFANDNDIEEIVVTARMVEESLLEFRPLSRILLRLELGIRNLRTSE